MKYGRILREVCASPWAITPERMADIVDVLAFQASGGKLTAEEIREYMDEPSAAAGEERGRGGVSIIPVKGIIHHRIEQVQNISGPGGTSTESVSRQFRQALNDRSTDAVVFDFRTPGGGVAGVDELATEIREARGGDKRVVAMVNSYAGSAGYYLAAQADEVVVTPSGQVGSIGVFAAHENLSEALAQQGREITLVSAGKYKVEGNPFEPLSDEAKAAIQERVDAFYGKFVDAVAAGRGVAADRVRNGFGEGRMVLADDALAEGMVDSIETMDDLVARLSSGDRPRSDGGRLRAWSMAFA